MRCRSWRTRCTLLCTKRFTRMVRLTVICRVYLVSLFHLLRRLRTGRRHALQLSAPNLPLMLRRFSSRASIFSPGTTRRIRRCGRLLKWRSCSRRRKIGVVSTIMSSFTGMRFLWSRRLILRIFMWIMRIPWRPPGGWVTPMCGRRRLITMMVLALTR